MERHPHPRVEIRFGHSHLKKASQLRHEIGVIADTHGLLRPEVTLAFEGVDLIIHAGDVGKAEVLDQLNSIARVIAVRGNNDKGEWAKGLPETEVAEVADVSIYLLHDMHDLDLSPSAAGFRVVVSGHSHHPRIEERDGVLYVNPGSAGPRRFRLPVTVARLTVEKTRVKARLIDLLDQNI